MEKIQVKIRNGMPETNSSSTHSLIINMEKLDSKEEILEKLSPHIKDGVLEVDPSEFGWEVEKYNDPYTKIQYVVAQICSRYFEYSKTAVSKELAKLSWLLKKTLGLKKVIIKLGEDLLWPSVDHQSTNLRNEILETDETLMKFIFNCDSWLFTSNDNGEILGDFIEPTLNAVDYGHIRVELPGTEIGPVDFLLPSDEVDIDLALDNMSGRGLLRSIVIENGVATASRDSSEDALRFAGPIRMPDGKWFFLWVPPHKLVDSSGNTITINRLRSLSGNHEPSYVEKIKSGEIKDGFVLVKLSIWSQEFGQIQ